MGAINAAKHPNSVFAHLYVIAANIWFVKSGKAMPIRLRQRDWPAREEEANGP